LSRRTPPAALGEGAEPVRLDGGVVAEHVVAPAVLRDEAEALRIVEPLHSTSSHPSVRSARVADPDRFGTKRHDGCIARQGSVSTWADMLLAPTRISDGHFGRESGVKGRLRTSLAMKSSRRAPVQPAARARLSEQKLASSRPSTLTRQRHFSRRSSVTECVRTANVVRAGLVNVPVVTLPRGRPWSFGRVRSITRPQCT